MKNENDTQSIEQLHENLRASIADGCYKAFIEFAQTLREVSNNVNTQKHGQSYLELDETALEPTGKSVSVDDVIAKIDKHLSDAD